jgi:hypothetical protein
VSYPVNDLKADYFSLSAAMGGGGKEGKSGKADKAAPEQLPSKRLPRTKPDESTKKPPPAQPNMSRPDVSKMLGFLDYHGKIKKEGSCIDLLEYYHNKASPEGKRLMLQSFVSAPGKALKWAKDFKTEETRSDKERVTTNENWFNR